MYKKERKTFFCNLDSSKICDNKTLWKTVQPFFFWKTKNTNKITLVDEDETVISDDQLISEELNQFFKNTTKALNIRENSYLTDKTELSDPVNKAISKYKNYPNILLIKDKIINAASVSISFSSWSDLLLGVPQGWILGLYFSVYILLTYFISLNRQMFATMPTIQHFMLMIQI